MSNIYFYLDTRDKKTEFRVKKLLATEDMRTVKLPGGTTTFEVKIKGSEDLQRVREISKRMPPEVSLKESYTQCIVESNSVLEAMEILLTRRMSWSLNTLALELMAGRDGDLVIDGKEIWIFSDSEESLRRVMLDIMYDERFHVQFKRDFKVVKKYPNNPSQFRESNSVRAHLDFKLTKGDLAYYRTFPVTKYFFFREEYEHWF